METRTDHACSSCAQKKRKCDRLLPFCSSCLKQKQQCRYKVPISVPVQESVDDQRGLRRCPELIFMPDGPRSETSLHFPNSISQAAILLLASDALRAAGACLQCHTKRRKCDKILPTCGRCFRQDSRCAYPKQALVLYGSGASFLRSLDMGRISATVPLPVESQPHMPMLVHSFIETFGMEPLPVHTDSFACLLRGMWIQQALSDPCALHTTLYAASAHLDAFRGVKISKLTLYHHTIALQLLQKRINDQNSGSNEFLMACIAPLVFFSALLGDKGSSAMHRKALIRIIKAQGGLEHLALGKFLSGLITVCVLTETIIMDSTLDLPFLEFSPTPLTPPSYFITTILRRATSRKDVYYNLSPRAVEIFENIGFVAHILPNDHAVNDIRAKWATNVEDVLLLYPDLQHTGHTTTDISMESHTDAVTEACHTAALIFWLLFLDDHEYLAPFSIDVFHYLVRKLRYALSYGSMDVWVKTAPEAHTWICLLGIAVASNLDDRVWFSLRHGQSVICIESKGASAFLHSWNTYDWANQRCKKKTMAAAAEEGILSEEGKEKDGREGKQKVIWRN